MGNYTGMSKPPIDYEKFVRWQIDFESLRLKVCKTEDEHKRSGLDVYKSPTTSPVILRICEAKSKKFVSPLNDIFIHLVENAAILKKIAKFTSNGIGDLTDEDTDGCKKFYIKLTRLIQSSPFTLDGVNNNIAAQHQSSQKTVSIHTMINCRYRGVPGKKSLLIFLGNESGVTFKACKPNEKEQQVFQGFVRIAHILDDASIKILGLDYREKEPSDAPKRIRPNESNESKASHETSSSAAKSTTLYEEQIKPGSKESPKNKRLLKHRFPHTTDSTENEERKEREEYEVELDQKIKAQEHEQKLKQELFDREEEVMRLKRKNHFLTEEVERLSGKCRQNDAELRNIKERLLESERMCKDPMEIVEHKNKIIKDREQQIENLTIRLASEMNKKISENETNFENISIVCRPMNVAEEYQNLCSNKWLDAKDVLDKNDVRDDISVKFLCEILMVSHRSAECHFKEIMCRVNGILQDPLAPNNGQPHTSVSKRLSDCDIQSLPRDVVVSIGDHFRRQAAETDIATLIKKTTDDISYKSKEFPKTLPLLAEGAIKSYIKQSSRLAWKMVIQRPPMLFAQRDINVKFKGEKEHPLAWGSRPSETAVVRYYQYPTMLHGDKIMVRGKVFVD